jgi:hypothetical protein
MAPHLILLNVINLIILGEEYKSRSSSVCGIAKTLFFQVKEVKYAIPVTGPGGLRVV